MAYIRFVSIHIIQKSRLNAWTYALGQASVRKKGGPAMHKGPHNGLILEWN
jgi:hypothetical protein